MIMIYDGKKIGEHGMRANTIQLHKLSFSKSFNWNSFPTFVTWLKSLWKYAKCAENFFINTLIIEWTLKRKMFFKNYMGFDDWFTTV